MKSWGKTFLVITGAVVLSTVAIQASDILQKVDGNLAGSLMESASPCGVGAVQLNTGNGALCVDMYEASAAPTCPHNSPRSGVESQDNLNSRDCQTVTVSEATPWRFVSLAQAQQLCARSGKRLPSNEEWYTIAVAQADQSTCVLNSSGPEATGVSNCVSAAGVHDVVGNVWEWINAEVIEGEINGRKLPDSGFVSVVDSTGVVVNTSDVPAMEYGEDYAKTATAGVYGVIRGGFYDSRSDGGLYAQNLAVPLNLQTDGVGFRCVKSL